METDVQLNTLGTAALEYAAKGWAVFPIAPRGKTPITTHGFKDATTDRDVIVDWWEKYPDANIGFATGNGLYVLDVDGEKGQDSLTCLETEHSPLPFTRECRTGTGRHFYFECDEELGNSASKLGENLDTRGDGGYVILPPSVHPNGAVYTWAADCEEAPLPEWLKPPKPKLYSPEDDEWTLRKTSEGRGSYINADEPHPYVAKVVQNQCDALRRQAEGGRNHELNCIAFTCGRIAAAGLASPAWMEQEVFAAANASGLQFSEIQKTWRSGFESGRLAQPFKVDEREDTWREVFEKRDKKRKPDASALKITPLSQVRREHVDFLWGYRLVQDAVNILVGDGGLGKSAVALHIARSITNGEPLPDSQGQMETGDVMFITYEDPPSLVKMRAKVLGIDLDHLYVIEGQEDENGNMIPFNQDDVIHLDAAITESYPNTKLLVVDPWTRYLDDEDFKDYIIRRALAPLEMLAQKHHLTVIVVAHVNKKTEGSAVMKISGSAGFKNTARSVLMVGKVTDTQTAVAHIKHNWSSPAPSVLYTWDPDKSWSDGENPLTWGETTHRDPDDLFAAKPPSKLDQCVSWLSRELMENREVDAQTIEETAIEVEKYTTKVLEMSKKKLGVIEETDQFVNGGKPIWRLPNAGE